MLRIKYTIFFNLIVGASFTTMCFFTIFKTKKENADRWNPVVYEWQTNGYFKNGGMWRLTQDPTFLKMVKAGTASLWTNKYDSSKEYFYRSNSFTFLLPRFIFQKLFGIKIQDESQTNLSILIFNQTLIAFGAIIFGYTCCNLLAPSVGVKNSVLCGLLIQLIFSSNPLVLNTYYGSIMCFHFLFIIPICAIFLGDFSLKNKNNNLLPILGYFFLLILDVVFGLIFISVVGILLWLQKRSDDFKIFAIKIIPLILAALSITGMQYIIVAANYTNVVFIGSSLMFRTGLDGDQTYYRTFIESLSKMVVLDSQGFLSNLHIRGLILGCFITPILASVLNQKLKLNKVTFFSKVTFISFLLYLCLFSQSFQIHPSYYFSWFLIPAIPAFFCIFFQNFFPKTNDKILLRWRLFFLTVIAFVIIFHGLRSWAAYG